MITAQVCSPVIGVGTYENPYRPRLLDIPGSHWLSDETAANQIPAPNIIVCDCEFTPEAFAAVQADTENYLVISWSDNG